MRKVSDFLSRTGGSPTSETVTVLPSKQPSTPRPEETERSSFARIGDRIGEDNEALRHLLIDTGLQFSALDELKATFSKLVDPLHNMLGTLEQAKFDNASLRGALSELRTSHDALRGEFEELEKTSSDLEGESQRLSRELTSAQESVQELEAEKVRLTGELAAVRVTIANLEKQLGDETSNGRTLSDEKRLLLERAETADKRILESESTANLARERLSLLENERDSLQSALDQTLAQSSKTARRLAEAENALADARDRLQKMEGSLAATDDERKKLAAAYDEANERRQSEVYALTLKLDAMRSRSTAAEKLLGEMRQSLVARTEEIRVAEAKLVEAVVGRNGAEKKSEQLAATVEAHDRQNKKLEQTRLSLTERVKVLGETVKARDSALSNAQDKIKALSDRGELLKAEAAANQAKAEKRIEQLNSAIERERAERAVAEGALEATRADYARLQREIVAERAMRRHSVNPDEVVDDQATEARPSKNGNGAGHGEPAATPQSGAA